MDMQMMVEQQGETLNNVEQNAETAAVNLNEGSKFLTRAITTAKSTRAVSIHLLDGIGLYVYIYLFL
jgi:syntaxin 1B/2/3